MQRNIILSVSAIIAIFALVIAVQNGADTTLSLFGMSLSVPLGVLLAVFFTGGMVAPLSFLSLRAAKEVASDKTQLEWQKQDVKLIKEIESDRVKQLEAKIVTLETALKTALKKKA